MKISFDSTIVEGVRICLLSKKIAKLLDRGTGQWLCRMRVALPATIEPIFPSPYLCDPFTFANCRELDANSYGIKDRS